MNLSRLLSDYRKQHRYTKEKMATLIGLEIHNYSRLESGKSKFARKKTLQKISIALQIPLQTLQKINHNPAISDISNKTYGLLTAIRRLDNCPVSTWLCSCACGKFIIVTLADLLNGKFSCGCKRRPLTFTDNSTWYLQDGTHLGKIRSRRLYANNKSGYRGVHLHSNGKWAACVRGKHLGSYTNLRDAVAARHAAEEKYIEPLLKKYELALK